ncbi:MAG: DNA-3-methyladenine glycosylase 2 family protein, partial [Betaproteobacteria bacterium]|nr:DNA-3-methyladenine glycosylase 2 family protein [Betaproteobacteria bacterium]
MTRTYEIAVVPPFRLDLTVNALRRLPTNTVDLLTPEGEYVRALFATPRPAIYRVTQIDHGTLSVRIDGARSRDDQTLHLVQKVLGTKKDLSGFDKAAGQIPWLSSLVRRMRGLKPPRYPSLWEACVNAVVFQQLSIRAASAITRRLIAALGERVETDSIPVPLSVFPCAERLSEATDDTLRATGLSGSKVATLRRIAEAVVSGALDAEKLEESTSQDGMAALCRIKGIGPWTAALILLRGLSRLDVFPANDTGAASNIALFSGDASSDPRLLLDTLGPQRG